MYFFIILDLLEPKKSQANAKPYIPKSRRQSIELMQVYKYNIYRQKEKEED